MADPFTTPENLLYQAPQPGMNPGAASYEAFSRARSRGQFERRRDQYLEATGEIGNQMAAGNVAGAARTAYEAGGVDPSFLEMGGKLQATQKAQLSAIMTDFADQALYLMDEIPGDEPSAQMERANEWAKWAEQRAGEDEFERSLVSGIATQLASDPDAFTIRGLEQSARDSYATLWQSVGGNNAVNRITGDILTSGGGSYQHRQIKGPGGIERPFFFNESDATLWKPGPTGMPTELNDADVDWLNRGGPSSGIQPGSIKVNDDGSVTVGLGTATRSAVERDIITAADRLDRVYTIRETFSPEYLQLGDRLGLEWNAVKETFLGRGSVDPQDRAAVQDFVNFQSSAQENINETVREISGAAVTAQEAVRLMAQLPAPGSNVLEVALMRADSPTEFVGKLDRVTLALTAGMMRREAILRDGHTLPGFGEAATTDADALMRSYGTIGSGDNIMSGLPAKILSEGLKVLDEQSEAGTIDRDLVSNYVTRLSSLYGEDVDDKTLNEGVVIAMLEDADFRNLVSSRVF